MALPFRSGVRGSSLLEAVLAAGLLGALLTGLLPLTTSAWNGMAAARRDLLVAHLARQRLHQLQALTFIGQPTGSVRDLQSRFEGGAIVDGGPGLSATGLAALDSVTTGWIDWIDERGDVLPGSVSPPPGAVFRRQWAVLDEGTPCLRLWVRVTMAAGTAGTRAESGAVTCAWGAGAS